MRSFEMASRRFWIEAFISLTCLSSGYDVDVVLGDGFFEPGLLFLGEGLESRVGFVFALGFDGPLEEALPVHLELIVGRGSTFRLTELFWHEVIPRTYNISQMP